MSKKPQGTRANEYEMFNVKLWRERLQINLQNLHRDVAEHAAFYAEIAELGARLKSDLHAAKNASDLEQAHVNSEVRLDPEKFGLEKVTESAIQTAVTLDARVRKVKKDVLRAQRDYDMVQVVVTAFEHRRSMLNNEVQLHTSNYWGESQSASVGSPEDRDSLRQARKKEIRAARRKNGTE